MGDASRLYNNARTKGEDGAKQASLHEPTNFKRKKLPDL